MNYYEQFYDDLEFCDPDEDPYYYRDPYYHNDPYYGNDPYIHDDPFQREDPRFYREHGDHEDERYYRERGHGQYHQDRRVPSSRGSSWGRGVDVAHGRGHGPLRDQGGSSRGRGMDGGRGRVRGTSSRDSDGSSRGRGNERNLRDRGRGRGRGNIFRGNTKSGMKALNFVKEGSSNSAMTSVEKTSEQEKNEKARGNESDQIRFDYRSFQNEPSESEKEVEQALKAYTCHLGFGYGYGPRTDLIEGEQPEWLIGTETDVQPDGQVSLNATKDEVMPEADEKMAPKTNVKTAMVSPACNFVKAKSEFHSIDVAFHETLEEEKPKPNSLSVNFGNKRVGLGFGVSASRPSAQSVDISASFKSGVKDGCNLRIDAKFKKLQDAVKARSLPNKNAIEILHMAVDKVKMVISDEVSLGNRTPTGQPTFMCRLEIDGIFIASGQATAKKAAKHEAYQNALKVVSHQALTVKEISQGVFALKQKDAEFKVPDVPGQLQNTGTKGTGQKPHYVPGQKSQTGPNQVAQSEKSVVQSASTLSQAGLSTYSKPKIVFHQPSHPLNSKPLEFKQSESPQTGSQSEQTGKSTPEALAMKLLNFVKEGANVEKQTEKSFPGMSQPTSCQRGSINQRNFAPQNTRKRPSGNLDAGRLKVQKKGGNVNHSIEDLSQFILIDSTPMNQTVNELSMLHNSANFNKVVLKLEYENDPNGVRCSLVLSDIIVAISHGPTKEDAKHQAAVDSLNYLREFCYTIKIKQAVDSDAGGLTKEQLLSDIQKAGEGGSNDVIPDSNIGNMLLRKMGWVGGGCGKDGTGIAEPVKAEMIIGREGLGLKAERGIGKNFHQRVTKMLQDYIKSDEQKDLHFSSELQKEERAIIHTIGQKLGLKTHSKGKNDNRYLIVSRKRSAQQLLEHVRESGGSTSKYELIPPGDPTLDLMRREDISHGHCKQ
ncbi:uncharacterized protein LOC123559200 [Mercenaria mercenaria]|uniref:uncharacterized protein LOC123559200 n=1 Tax=Mercenaria mercenaria TaxID=6596 RepID=UPI00234E6C3A|nr:uncharacterized protein LOC123559200 [Mercenaria mercenaria]